MFLLVAALSAVSLLPFAHARPQADSVVLFIGDGMGPGQIEMTAGAVGHPLAMQKMPYSGTVTTLSIGGRVTDSAAASTALATGHKAENGVISVSPDGKPYQTILERCLRSHKTAGVITTDALWGATPAGFATHAQSRGEKSSIALQTAQSRAQVMMGYGKDQLLPKSAGGKREDGRDLIAWLKKAGYGVVYTRDELLRAENQKLVGLFDDGPQAPRIADMVSVALDRLAANASGFFLMVEGARVDWAGHESDPLGAFLETRDLDEAVAQTVQFARRRGGILVLVTADHETGGLQVEAPSRLPVLGRAKGTIGEIASHLNADRTNVQQVMAEYAGITDLTPQEIQQIKQAKEVGPVIGSLLSERAGVKWTSDGDHTATPVRVFAFGPGAERFTGEMDNTDIPGRIAEALGIGPFPKP
jgi:alkaline phosphatase